MANIADYMFSFLRAEAKPVPVQSSTTDPLVQALHQLGVALRQRGGIVQQSDSSSVSCESVLSVANAVHSKFDAQLVLEDDFPCTLQVEKKRRRSHLLDDTLRLGNEVEQARALTIDGERTKPRKNYLRRFINERPSFLATYITYTRASKRCQAARMAYVKDRACTVEGQQFKTHGAIGKKHSCYSSTKSQLRKRRGGGGNKPILPQVREELFQWFIDTVHNIRGRIPGWLILDQANVILQDAIRHLELQVENGTLPPETKWRIPKINAGWLRGWRQECGVTWRTVNLRFKCTRKVLLERLIIFWENILHIRELHAALYPPALFPDALLGFADADEKPLWFTASADMGTYALRGSAKVAVKENVPMTRARFTAKTLVRWPKRIMDDKQLAIMFKVGDNGTGEQIARSLRVPPGCLLQFAPKGSYREAQNVQYYSWLVDVNESWEKTTCWLLDWAGPNHMPSVHSCFHDRLNAHTMVAPLGTCIVQGSDTHLHGPYSGHYKRMETKDAQAQLRLRPHQLPSTSRQTVLDRACASYELCDHQRASNSFVENGIANALDGSEDHRLTAEAAPFWIDGEMPRRRLEIRVKVKAKVASGELHSFAQYRDLLQYFHNAPPPDREGAEAFDVHIPGAMDDALDDDGVDTDPEIEDEHSALLAAADSVEVIPGLDMVMLASFYVYRSL